MPLLKSSLAADLESLFKGKPSASPDAALTWAKAYASYASGALSTLSSLPVTAAANQSLLVGAFTSAFSTMTSAGAAALMAQGVIGFWTAMVWAGPTAAGTTIFPGNPALASALAAIFADTSNQTESDKARALADAFDSGAKMVIVSDIPLVQPAPPVVGPVS